MVDGSGEALYIRIDRELQGHVSSDSLSCSIFKVPNHLRKINEMAYEPQGISIGPYHRDKPHLKAMEVHKKHYLKMLLNRKKENTVKKYVKALEGLKEKALKFYSEPPDQKVGDQFVEMMLFDGCFVVELIRKSAMEELREENDHLLTHFILRTVMRDMLLIENQLPFFILMELFDMTKMPNEAHQNFMHMAVNCFSIMMPGPCNKKIENHPGIKHLLGLLHHSCVSPPESPKGVRPRSPEAMAIACSAKLVSSSTTKLSEIVKSLSSYAVRMKPNLSGFKLVSSAKSRSRVSGNANVSSCSTSFVRFPPIRFPPIKTTKEEKSLPSNTVLSLDEKVNPLSFSSKVSPPESLKGVKPRSPEATAIARSAKSVSSSTTKPPGIVESFSPDAVLVSSALSVSRVSGEGHGLLCSASFLTFSPNKTSKEENSLPSNTVLMTPQQLEIEEESASFGVLNPQMDVRSFLSSDRDFSVATDAPLGVPPSKMSEGVNSLPSNTILTNIHHSEMEAESESFVVSGSSIGAIEDTHHRHCSMKSKEAISRTVKSEGHEEKNDKWQTIRSATELREAGIKFEKIEGRLFDINFEKGIMSIPTIKIVDDTESILRNLVVYEQCYKDISSRHFTDYGRFMACIINTGKDVELLRRHEVIENRLGDNEVIADIFNRICDSVLIAEEDFSYADLFVKVNKHCRKRRNRWKANLRHNYFNTPWASISVIAAVFLLLLTVLQSVYSVLAYQHRR